MTDQKELPHFHFLTPDVILQVAEGALGKKFSGLCRPYKSYINRVYEIETSEREALVIKFYRPKRWSQDALQDEHDFLLDMAESEIPVIAPLPLKKGETLGKYEDTYFAIFPKKGGRNCDEFTTDQWLELGRLMSRVHSIGEQKKPRARIQFTPDHATRDHISFILNGGFIPDDIARPFSEVTNRLVDLIQPLFENKPLMRIHGDCHFANIIYRPGESLYLIDLDDMVLGTPIQDIWMLLPGYVHDSRTELNLFIEGYETFRTFDYTDLKLVEPLRAMRYIHYTAWCAHQVADGGFSQIAPEWGSRKYWQTEISDLTEQIEMIEKNLSEE